MCASRNEEKSQMRTPNSRIAVQNYDFYLK